MSLHIIPKNFTADNNNCLLVWIRNKMRCKIRWNSTRRDWVVKKPMHLRNIPNASLCEAFFIRNACYTHANPNTKHGINTNTWHVHATWKNSIGMLTLFSCIVVWLTIRTTLKGTVTRALMWYCYISIESSFQGLLSAIIKF